MAGSDLAHLRQCLSTGVAAEHHGAALQGAYLPCRRSQGVKALSFPAQSVGEVVVVVVWPQAPPPALALVQGKVGCPQVAVVAPDPRQGLGAPPFVLRIDAKTLTYRL